MPFGSDHAMADRSFRFDVRVDEDDILIAECGEIPDFGVLDFSDEGMEELLPHVVARLMREREGGNWEADVEREGKHGYRVIVRSAPTPR
jgi:hypothetical protein